MKTMLRSVPGLLLISVLLASCGSVQPVAQVRDDVYFLPSLAPPPPVLTESAATEEPAPPTDDYYDPNATTDEQAQSRDFYDMTYNDPYYYNYGRFGFGTGLGWQSGWNGPGWGMGMGWGSGWNNSWYNMSLGWGSPYYGGYGAWGSPYYGGSSPWGWNDPYYGGYGYGNYYSPYGNCSCCYTPVIIGGSSGVVVGHRPSMNGGGGSRPGNPGQVRATFRDPVRLASGSGLDQFNRGTDRQTLSAPARNSDRSNGGSASPTTRPSGKRPSVGSDHLGREASGTKERSGDHLGVGSSPSPSGGGGSGGSTGGGSRSGGGGRPR
ncbi:MAG: hypothetical protein ABI432_14380 [Flavobacteriales bacterium]